MTIGRWFSALVALAGAVALAACTEPRTATPSSASTEVSPGAVANASSPSESTVSREAWTFASYPGWRIRTPNYDLHTTLEHPRVLERLPVFLEAAMERYTTALAPLPPPPGPLTAYVFEDRRQWTAKMRELLPDQADLLDRLGRGGFSTRGVAVLYYIDWRGRDRDTFAITAHEGWHQYTQRTFRSELPIWLEEGIATWMEGHQYRGDGPPTFLPHLNWERRYAVRRSLRTDRVISLDELVTGTPQDFLARSKDWLLAYYGQVWALTRFLVEHDDGRYAEALSRVLADAADGSLGARVRRHPLVIASGRRPTRNASEDGRAVLLAYFTDDLPAFEREYVAFMRRIAGL